MTKAERKVIEQLIKIGTEELRHLYAGVCPDRLEGHEIRDVDCPACQILVKAEELLHRGNDEKVD